MEMDVFHSFVKIKYRYASLYFCMCIDANDNELEVLEIIHHFVEILDRYFGSVSQYISFVLFLCLFFKIYNADFTLFHSLPL